MADAGPDIAAKLQPELRDMKIEEGVPQGVAGESVHTIRVKAEDRPSRSPTPMQKSLHIKREPATQSSVGESQAQESFLADAVREEVVGGEITLKMEPGKAPKLSRTASQKLVSRPRPSYLNLPDATSEAKSTFSVMTECTYANKSLGTTEHAYECDCSEEWDPVQKVNRACGDDDCVNRATKMECSGDCGCGRKCQNQRFLRKKYANVGVIKTDKKGFGLRANASLEKGQFIFEYIGEVIDERTFRRRMLQYDEEGIKHFYFMSLVKGQFVDATKRGNLGRFCNHSCNPNCEVDKWVVGDKLRMGIFALQDIKAGEELVFNYNVDRYGADPQPCYCGEPNCVGFIGGKTQTDNATKLSHATIEALGIDDGDGWDTAMVRKPRKKKASEDDEEYVDSLQPRSLDAQGVKKVMAALRQCTEKWIAVKLLDRLQKSQDEKVGHAIFRVHGYDILRMTITTWQEDSNVVLQVLDLLYNLPRITRNKIHDSGIEEVVQKQRDDCEDERVKDSATKLLEAWAKLQFGYRIARRKLDPNAGTPARVGSHFERREKGRERSRSRSKSPTTARPPSGAPSGPRVLNAPKGPAAFVNAARPPPRPRPFNPLPAGWFQATSETGAIYYYNAAGDRQWQRPSLPTETQRPAPSKAKSDTQVLQDIISGITRNLTPNHAVSATATPQPAAEEAKEKTPKSEKWKSMPQEKLEKLYEQTISKHVLSITSRYRKYLEKDEVKRLSKEVAKKLVRGDFKSGRVKDPTAPLSSKHIKTIRNYVKEFMEKAVKKKLEREKAKGGQSAKEEQFIVEVKEPDEGAESDDPMDDVNGEEDVSPGSPAESVSAELKRKREAEDGPGSPKKNRTEPSDSPLPPPPPPPPPAEDMPVELEAAALTPADDTAVPFENDGEADVVDIPDIPNGRGKGRQGGLASPMQLATPPTNGSMAQHICEDGAKKDEGLPVAGDSDT